MLELSMKGRFIIPVGDVIMADVYITENNDYPKYRYSPHKEYTCIAESRLWWCPEDKLDQVKMCAEKYTKNGFSFHVGRKGQGTYEFPEVIEYEDQERCVGSQWSVSTRGIEARMGDRLVWLDIEDTEKAYDFLKDNSDIPCAVRIDMERYTDDDRYAQVIDIANNYFIYYYTNDTPKPLIDIPSGKDYIRDMYDI
jgi:hypothetical protein